MAALSIPYSASSATAGIDAPAASVAVEKLNRQHPEHLLYYDGWNKLDLLHASGIRLKNRAEDFLIKRPKEIFDVYQERIRRFTDAGILGTAIGWYLSAMFRKDPDIGKPAGTDAWYDTFLDDCDGGGTGYFDMWREVFKQLTLNHISYILIDLPGSDDAKSNVVPITRADERQAGLTNPILSVFDARQVINWSMDRRGNLDWIIARAYLQRETFLGDVVNETVWYYFDRQEYRVYRYQQKQNVRADQSYAVLYDPNGNRVGATPMADLVDRGPHALSAYNRVPVRRIEVPEALWLANRAYLQLMDHINQTNSLAWALFIANLAMPVIIGQANITNLVLSEAGFLHLSDPQAKIEWLENNGTSFSHSSDRVASLRQEIYRAMYLQAQAKDASATAAGASGYSKEQDMIPASDALNGFGKIVRMGMQNVLDDVALARGDNNVKFDVNGFKFETKPATVSIALCDEYTGLNLPSDTALQYVQKRTVRDVMDGANADLVNKACKEIDAAPTQSELLKQKQDQQKQQFAASLNAASGAGQTAETSGLQSKFSTLDARSTAKDELSALNG